MSRRRKYLCVGQFERVGRVAATLMVLPALVLSPLTARAILIHVHHGHDTHTHALSVHELDALQHDPEHRHEHHEHDGPGFDRPDGDESSVVIVVNPPVGTLRSRVASGGAGALAGTHAALASSLAAFVTPQSDRPCGARPPGKAPPVRVGGSLAGILLTSQALLL